MKNTVKEYNFEGDVVRFENALKSPVGITQDLGSLVDKNNRHFAESVYVASNVDHVGNEEFGWR